MLVLPLLLLFVFDRSERATREWMGAGMDLDLEVLQLVSSEDFTVTGFVDSCRSSARGFRVVVADMYCLLRLELELSVHARAMIMARGAGLDLKADSTISEASLAEREYLRRLIGRAGLLALRPLQVDQSSRQLASRAVEADTRRRGRG